MAKQTGEYKITGTYDDVTYYKMEGQYYARKKSSLKGTRVKRDPRFKRTMEWAGRLARGSQLASEVYRSLPREEQVYALFCTLKSTAIRGLKEGKSEAEVVQLLRVRVAAENGAYGNARQVVGAMKKPQAVALKTGTEYSRIGVSREGRLLVFPRPAAARVFAPTAAAGELQCQGRTEDAGRVVKMVLDAGA